MLRLVGAIPLVAVAVNDMVVVVVILVGKYFTCDFQLGACVKKAEIGR